MITIAEALKIAAAQLLPGSETPRLDAQLLLGHVLGTTRSALIAQDEAWLAEERQAAFEALVRQRAQGAPVAYLTGMREFWSLAVGVSPAVLVPRPETEMLVELALQRLPPQRPCSVLDLGTGSGAVALAIASERPLARVTGTDISAAALAIATANARRLGQRNVRWRLGSWFAAAAGERFDLIVSNPPYIGADDPALARLRAEPALALTPGPSGLEALAAIVAGAAEHLAPGGWLLLEHGSGQAEDVSRLFEQRGFLQTRTHPDHSDLPRVTLATTSRPT
jgi:release factor glutamine methyltransferase